MGKISSSPSEVSRQVGPDTYLTVERVFTRRQRCTCGRTLPAASDEKHALCIKQEYTCKCGLTWQTCTPFMPREGMAWELRGKRRERGAKKSVLPKKEN